MNRESDDLHAVSATQKGDQAGETGTVPRYSLARLLAVVFPFHVTERRKGGVGGGVGVGG